MDDLTKKRLEQLRNYARWERENGPGARVHVLDWAAAEIERLHRKLDAERNPFVRAERQSQ